MVTSPPPQRDQSSIPVACGQLLAQAPHLAQHVILQPGRRLDDREPGAAEDLHGWEAEGVGDFDAEVCGCGAVIGTDAIDQGLR